MVNKKANQAFNPAEQIGHQVKLRRLVLGLTLGQASTKTGVSQTVICEIEGGKRTPSLRTYEKLRDGLGLEAPEVTLVRAPRAERPTSEEYLTRLAACILMTKNLPLADAASALGVSIPAIREGLVALQERMAAVGMRLVEDGVEVSATALGHCTDQLATLGQLQFERDLSPDACVVLGWIIYRDGKATRAEIERLRRGQDSTSILTRLTKRGLIAGVEDPQSDRRTNVYRATTTALSVLGYSSVAEIQAFILPAVEAALGAEGVLRIVGRKVAPQGGER